MSKGKCVSGFLALLLAAVLSAAPATMPISEKVVGTVSEGLRLDVSINTAHLAAGDRVMVDVELTNASAEFLTIPVREEDRDFDIIAECDGRPVATTAFGKFVLEQRREPSRRTFIELNPGQTVSYSIDSSRRIDMTRPGEYVLKIQRAVPKLADKGGQRLYPTVAVTSGAIRLKLPDAPPKLGVVTPEKAGEQKKLEKGP